MERLVTGLLAGIVLFWFGACYWVRGDGVPDWWLPAAFTTGLAATAWIQKRDHHPGPRWAQALAWLVICTAVAATCFGALATTSRHWDGAASFDAKVFWLQETPTLLQPFFAAPGVFHHSPDYPLLQPLLVAMTERLAPGLGRIVLPMFYLLLCGVVATALQRRGVAPLLRIAITVAVAVTPSLLTPGGGAVDSGYSECLLLLATTTVAAGLLNARTLWFALGITLMLAAKPEGLPYAVAALTVAFARRERHLLWPGLAALAMAMIAWEPVRADLLHRDGSHFWLMAMPLAAVAVLVADKLCTQWGLRNRGRWIFILIWPMAALLCLPWLAPWLGSDNGALAVYLRQAQDVHTGFASLPAYAAAMFEYGIARMRLGTVLLLPIGIVLVAWRQRIPLADRGVMAWTLLGLATTALPFVLSPEPDVEHHLKSSLPRLLLHWIGPLWLLNGAWLDTVLRCRTHRDRPS